MSDVEATLESYPAAAGLTDVPAPLRGYFESQGMRLSWQNATPESLSSNFGRGIRPVRLADIDDDEVREQLADMVMVNDRGYLQRWDAVLCIQDEASYNQLVAYKDRMRQRRQEAVESVDDLADELTNLMQQAGFAGGELHGNVPKLSEQVFVSKSKSPPGADKE